MKTSHIFWGTLFIFLGLLVLINNLAPINFNWGNLWDYWPLVLIIFGIAMLVKNKFGKGLLAGLAAIFLAIVLFTSIRLTSNFVNGDFQFVFDDDSDSNYTISEYSETISTSINKAKFELDAGVGSFNIQRSTEDLIYVKAKGKKNNYHLTRLDTDSLSELKLKMKERTIHFGKNDLTNKVDISLNENPLWDLDVNVGAASIDLLDMAMDELLLLKPPLKKRFLQACISCIAYDGKVTVQAYELARAIASCLECPMPPLLLRQG